MWQYRRLFRPHEKVVERLLDRHHECVVQYRELFDFLRIFDQFLSRLDPQRFGEPGVALSLSALLYAFELDGFPCDGVGGGGTAGGALADVAAWAGLFDGGGAGLVFRA